VQSRIAVIVGAGIVVLAVGIGAWWMMSSPPAEPAGRRGPEAPPPSAASTPEPKPAAPAATLKPSEPPPTTPPAAPTTGTLVIRSDVPDTSVFIDRKYLGTAPVTVRDLRPGTHRLNMSPTGYDSIAEDIEVAAGTHEISRSFKTLKPDAKIDVVHKHAFGSCQGTLRASPHGITYETTHKDDGFTVALTDLETFAIDYPGKFMTLKIRKGKSYKLTDPEDNVDRLFVFHRDVDKVRQRGRED